MFPDKVLSPQVFQRLAHGFTADAVICTQNKFSGKSLSTGKLPAQNTLAQILFDLRITGGAVVGTVQHF